MLSPNFMDDILNMPSWLEPSEPGSSTSVAEATSRQGLMSPPTLESYRADLATRGLQDAQTGGSVDFCIHDFPIESGMQLAFLGVNCNIQVPSGLPFLQSMHPDSMLSTPSNFVPASSLGLTLDSRSWHQPSIEEVQQPLLKTEMFTNSNNGPNHLYATRVRDAGVPLCFRANNDETRGLFNAYGAPRPPVPGLQANSPRAPFKSPSKNSIAGALRPRVRARRGQATDPHSIAERKRRERIAKTIKDLQVLLPNANKSDKGILLDEIIEYIKFLQLQTKVFRIGTSLLPSECYSSMAFNNKGTTSESLVTIERQVVQLMDENMDAALQFLQSNGFCLMPISMAAANCVYKPIFSK